jgi:DNA-binding CsgD family transcriptional regulator
MKPEDSLTARQFETVQLLARGLQQTEIARLMDIGLDTVKSHLKMARLKTGAESRLTLGMWFKERYPNKAARRMGYLLACEMTVKMENLGRRTAIARRRLAR